LDTGTILLVLCCTCSATEFLLEFSAQGLQIFAVILPACHQTLNLFAATL
jgi:hypothetical protein